MKSKIRPHSIDHQLNSKTLSIASKISFILFVTISLYLVYSTISFQTTSISDKIKIDRKLLVQSAKIGDLFFVKRYLVSFVEVGEVRGAGIRGVSGEWVAQVPDGEQFAEESQIGWSSLQYPITIELSKKPVLKFFYIIDIKYNILLTPFLLSLAIGLVVFFILGEFKSLIKTVDNQRVELQKKEILEEKIKISRQVAHDVRSPMGALKTAAEAIEKNPKAASELIQKAVRRIDQIVNDLMPSNRNRAITKGETSQVNICSLIRELVKEKELEYQTYKLPVKIEMEFEFSNVFIKANASSLFRAISNTVNNGIEAVEGKSVEIGLRLYRSGEKIILDISDNGKGVDPALLPRIFDHGFTVGKLGGSGMGLAQAKAAILECGGDIEVRSQGGIGTHVSLIFSKWKS